LAKTKKQDDLLLVHVPLSQEEKDFYGPVMQHVIDLLSSIVQHLEQIERRIK